MVRINNQIFPRRTHLVEQELIVQYTLPEKAKKTWSIDAAENTMMCCDTGAPTTVAGESQAKQVFENSTCHIY
jgi:hypothetical protein